MWSALGTGNEHPSGVLVGGCDNGTITLWNVDAIMKWVVSVLYFKL